MYTLRMILLFSFYLLSFPLLADETLKQTDSSLKDPKLLEIGKAIYMDGILPSGQPVQATMHGDVHFTGKQIACVSCHRRSGLGSSEGEITVLPITGTELFVPRVNRSSELLLGKRSQINPASIGTLPRPAYTDALLIKALQESIDPTGRSLHPSMPRYHLDNASSTALIAYLKSLSSKVSPGITKGNIHFATVITEEVTAEKRKILVDTLNAFFKKLNAETRHEGRRARNGPWHKEWHYQSYRKWKLHVWDLKGPQETWEKQLNDYYQQQNVFAMLSGISTQSWQPIHAFCEKSEIPCLLPNTDLPVISDEDFYTLYFSKGMTLNAEVLAKYIADKKDGRLEDIIQVYRETDAESRVSATVFRAAAAKHNIKIIQDLSVPSNKQINGEFWETLLQQSQPKSLLLWLRDTDLKALNILANHTDKFNNLYLAVDLTQTPPSELIPKSLQERTYIVYPYALPKSSRLWLIRTKAWLRASKIELTDERLQANVYFAVTLVAIAIKRMRALLIRNFLLERIEHGVDNMLVSSVYPRLTLGPDQRYTSTGGYIVKLEGDENKLTPVSKWLIP